MDQNLYARSTLTAATALWVSMETTWTISTVFHSTCTRTVLAVLWSVAKSRQCNKYECYCCLCAGDIVCLGVIGGGFPLPILIDVKVSYIAEYVVLRIAQCFTLTPQTCSFQHQFDFSRKHSAMLQLLHSFLYHQSLSVARYLYN